MAQAQASSAAGDLTPQEPVLVTVKFGDERNMHRFFPDNPRFETGKLYRLRLENPSLSKHYFSSAKFSEAVYTRKVEVFGKDGKPAAEVNGTVREIEVFPGGVAQWWFVRPGDFDDLRRTVEGHAEAGIVTNQSPVIVKKIMRPDSDIYAYSRNSEGVMMASR